MKGNSVEMELPFLYSVFSLGGYRVYLYVNDFKT